MSSLAADRLERLLVKWIHGAAKQLKRLFRRKSEGAAHVTPTVPVSILLAISAILVTLLLYGAMIQWLQGWVKQGIDKAPVVRHILDSSLGQPLQPFAGRSVLASDGLGEISDKYADKYPVDPSEWLEVLKRLGLVDAESSLKDYFGDWSEQLDASNATENSAAAPSLVRPTVDDDNKPVAQLIVDLENATAGLPLGRVTTLPLLSNLAYEMGKFGSDGVTGSRACWSAALLQITAGYPDRWASVVDAVRGDAVLGDGGCPWLGGALADQPSMLRYSHYILDSVPDANDIVRALFGNMGVMKAAETPPNNFESLDATARAALPNEKVLVPPPGSPVSNMQHGANVFAWELARVDSDKAREEVLAETFSRQLLAAMMTTGNVSFPKLLLDMALGLPQLILNCFFAMLVVFIVTRWLLFLRMRAEIRTVTKWLDRDIRKAMLDSDEAQRVRAATLIADKLQRYERTGGALPDAKSVLSGIDAATIPIDGETRSTLSAQPGKPEERLFRFRARSLVLLMAEKATRRLVDGEDQLELFREFCASRRTSVDESAWLMRYLARALPALGFVGTILGILFALNGADGIVRATTQAERVAAMASVTAPLAFAFSHTFIALVFGLLTGFFIDQLSALERVALLSYEETLFERIDPAERVRPKRQSRLSKALQTDDSVS